MSFECESSIIPFLKSFTPHDTFKINKQGSSIRLDFSNKNLTTQIRKAKDSKRECSNKRTEKNVISSSFIFKGRGTSNEGELLFAEKYFDDKGRERGYSLNVLTDMYAHRIEQDIEKLLKKKENSKSYAGLSFKMEPCKDWRGGSVNKLISGY